MKKNIFLIFFIVLIMSITGCLQSPENNSGTISTTGNKTKYVDHGVTLAPHETTITILSTQQYSASLSSGPATTSQDYNWTIIEINGGNIDADGLYTPPLSAGTFNIKAVYKSDTSKYGFAIVHVALTGTKTYNYEGTITCEIKGDFNGINHDDRIDFGYVTLKYDGKDPVTGEDAWALNSHVNTQYYVYDITDSVPATVFSSNGWQTYNDSSWALEMDFDYTNDQLKFLINGLVISVTLTPPGTTTSYIILGGGGVFGTLPIDKSTIIGSNTIMYGVVPIKLSWNLTRVLSP